MKNAIMESVADAMRSFEPMDLLYLAPILAVVGILVGVMVHFKTHAVYSAIMGDEANFGNHVPVSVMTAETPKAEPTVIVKMTASESEDEETAAEVADKPKATEACENTTEDEAETETETEDVRVEDAEVLPEKSLLSVMEIVTKTGVSESRVRKSIKAAEIEAAQQIRNNGRLVKIYDFEVVRKVLEEKGFIAANDEMVETPAISEDTILSIMEIVKTTGVSESCVRKDIKAAGLDSITSLKSGNGRVVKGYRFGDVKHIMLKRNRLTQVAC